MIDVMKIQRLNAELVTWFMFYDAIKDKRYNKNVRDGFTQYLAQGIHPILFWNN